LGGGGGGEGSGGGGRGGRGVDTGYKPVPLDGVVPLGPVGEGGTIGRCRVRRYRGLGWRGLRLRVAAWVERAGLELLGLVRLGRVVGMVGSRGGVGRGSGR